MKKTVLKNSQKTFLHQTNLFLISWLWKQ